MEIDLISLFLILVAVFFLGRLSKGIKIRTGNRRAPSPLEKAEGSVDESPQLPEPDLKVEPSVNFTTIKFMDYVMSSVMFSVLLWIVNNLLSGLNTQFSYIHYVFYFFAEIVASYPLVIRPTTDEYVGLTAGAGATILTLMLNSYRWVFWDMTFLAISLLCGGMAGGYLVKKNILKKKVIDRVIASL